ncbi:hypothetical protein [Nocardioides ferulae]|uniref:hypothetical protein n=1 Tax=Nocardioides ferulae TaxID=2340821 RepID=UPI000EB3ACB2|nr:hypothetical protein [Nocardioides ferulae]
MRRWLLLLPLALVLALASSASRLHVFWWPDQLHEATAGSQGSPVEVSDEWEDQDGETHRRDLTLTVLAVAPAERVPTYDGTEPVRPIPGTVLWEVRLGFEVEPDVPLGSCRVSMIDTEGREAWAVRTSYGEQMLPMTVCEPTDSPGPGYAGLLEEVPGEEPSPPRPREYVVPVYVLAADDATPDRIRVWWEPPDYVEVEVDPDDE